MLCNSWIVLGVSERQVDEDFIHETITLKNLHTNQIDVRVNTKFVDGVSRFIARNKHYMDK